MFRRSSLTRSPTPNTRSSQARPCRSSTWCGTQRLGSDARSASTSRMMRRRAAAACQSKPRQRLGAIFIRSCEARLGEISCDRAEAVAVARPTGQRLEVSHSPVATDTDAAHEDLRVLSARMTAAVAKRRVLALRADFERASRSGKLVAAVPAHAEHPIRIGRVGTVTEPSRGHPALPSASPLAGWKRRWIVGQSGDVGGRERRRSHSHLRTTLEGGF